MAVSRGHGRMLCGIFCTDAGKMVQESDDPKLIRNSFCDAGNQLVLKEINPASTKK